MSTSDLEQFMNDWAAEAAKHSRAGNDLRLQQNENYWRRVLLAHVADPEQRLALGIARRALVAEHLARGEAA